MLLKLSLFNLGNAHVARSVGFMHALKAIHFLRSSIKCLCLHPKIRISTCSKPEISLAPMDAIMVLIYSNVYTCIRSINTLDANAEL